MIFPSPAARSNNLAILAQWSASAVAVSSGNARRKLGPRLGPHAMPACRPATARCHHGGHLGSCGHSIEANSNSKSNDNRNSWWVVWLLEQGRRRRKTDGDGGADGDDDDCWLVGCLFGWLVGRLSGVGRGAKSPFLYIKTPDRPPLRLLLVFFCSYYYYYYYYYYYCYYH